MILGGEYGDFRLACGGAAREKLMARGPEALSDAELLAIFYAPGLLAECCGSGAREMLSTFWQPECVDRFADEGGICAVPGMGPAKYVQLQAVIEMARACPSEQLEQRDVSTRPVPCAIICSSSYDRCATRCSPPFSRYTESAACCGGAVPWHSGADQRFPREIVKRALFHNAAAITVCA